MVSPLAGQPCPKRRPVRFAVPQLLALFSLLLPERTPATVLLYRITDSEILVGADSFFEVDGVEQPPTAVKIHQLGPFFYAIQGKSRIGETKLAELIEKSAAEPQGEIWDFAPVFQQDLTRWLHETSRIRPDLFRPYGTNGVVITSFQLFGFRKGAPFMEALEFVTQNFGTSVTVRRQQMQFRQGKPNWIPVGTWTQGQPAKDFLTLKDPVDHMRFLFDREFRAAPPPGEPKLARPPLDILRVSRNGARWVQKKPECPEIKSCPAEAESAALSSTR
jgi:hypothetical protein